MIQYHPVVAEITKLLAQHNVLFKTFEHAPVSTSEEAARLRPEYSLHQGAKALIVKTKPKGFLMLVVPGDMRFNESKVRLALDIREIRFAKESEVSEITGGVQVGGVPPFGNLFNLPVYVDKSVLENEEIIFNAGDRAYSIAMKSADYKNIVNPNVVEIV
ncbi:MAG TPA: YbaK/EbsC family protein [Candidatus Paceibacterota bacterium]